MKVLMVNRTDPYQVLGVSRSASTDDLRRAYRRALRRSHPDTGGTAVEFHSVQAAWLAVGTPEERARFDRATHTASTRSARIPTRGFSPWAATREDTTRRTRRSATRPSYGHPGGWWRSQYLSAVDEWATAQGRTVDPYAPETLAQIPAEVHERLNAALTEEATAAALAGLGTDFTVWHDVSTDVAGGNPNEKLDHVVLGPTGLFGLLSEARPGGVLIRGGDVTGDSFGWRERPIHTLAARARFFSESVGVRFTGVVMIVPDNAGIAVPTEVSRHRGLSAVVVQLSDLAAFLTTGLPGVLPVSRDAVATAGEHLRRSVQFV
ncbi:MAG: hypothetical protein JWQ43_4093 [Glaciihabitans sp.]|nr:hypothetical protein [Glaciihabitans sp.]